MKRTLCICICFCLLQTEAGFFSSQIDKLKNKAKAAYKSKPGPTLNFWGHEQSEYPGANAQFREENRAKWEEYYQCLNSQANNLNSQNSVTPEAIIGFETSSISLTCKLCLSPLESQNKDAITWEFARQQDEAMSPVEFTEHTLLSPEDRTLQIFNLKSENSGQYMCKLGNAVVAPYFLTVVNISETSMHQVHSPADPSGPYSKKPEEIAFNLVLDTEWGEWSTCSTCGNVGRKHKMGYCNVYRKALESNNRTKRSAEELEEIFQIFKYGIPCQSHILPPEVRRLPAVQARRNEIMTGFCHVKCPENLVFEVRDKEGKVIERADNSEGIYSLSQKLPPMEPSTERRLQYEAKGKDLVLECPGNINSDAPILWQIGDKNLIPEKIAKESNGRVYISITDRVHIKKAKISDSNIYSCWQLQELAGTIRLVVEKRYEFNFNHTLMLLGVVLIMGTFLYVFVKVIANRELSKTRLDTLVVKNRPKRIP
ncbi:hypothetical protein HUJ05_007527 [Dendroctonus ponderosae]|nr:hypothetical protein HUJ05_007527 [Dendroctonus ponderosae]